ncbi:Hydrolase [Venturia inaequalis]|nr:Hydrolase [Venturia inaequalis]
MTLFYTCSNMEYHPKPSASPALSPSASQPPSYGTVSNWRPIALLSTAGRLLEKIPARRLTNLAVRYGLLPGTQMGLVGRATSTILMYLVDLNPTTWSQGYVVSPLGLDISQSYPRIVRAKLVRLLQSRMIPDWLVKCVDSFLDDRESTLTIPGHTSEAFSFDLGILC